jgi:hypothetical protein
VLLTVASTIVALAGFFLVVVALSFAAGASPGFFGEPPTDADEWWFPYALAWFVAVEVAAVVSAFVLSQRRIGYAALPLAPLPMLAVVVVLLGAISE